MVVPRFGFDNVVGNESVRGMAVRTGGPLMMRGVEPAFIYAVHHVAIITSVGLSPR